MTEQFKLQVVEKEDLSFIHELFNDPQIMKYWFEEPYHSKAQLEDFFNKNNDSHNLRQFIFKRNEEKLGYIGFYNIEWTHRKAEFGIMIDPKHQGNGYAKSAVKLAIDYAFSILNLHKIYLIVDQENEKAIHIYEKAGFHIEAELKDEYFVNGSYHNTLIMSIFQSEYFGNQKK